MLEVHVIDNGKGIKPEEMSSLFKKFGKLRRTAAMNNEGIGLGLMICQKLVSLNKGTISVRSDGENLGSVFSFTMKMMQIRKSTESSSESLLSPHVLMENSERDCNPEEAKGLNQNL